MDKERNEKRKRRSNVGITNCVFCYYFLLFFILAIFSVLFQRWNIQTIANESATRVAQTYKLMDADVDTGYVSKSKVAEVREYRYIWNNV